MKKPLLLIIILLLLIPFFWFKPGEINLGGDSSRLYFYDPISYLNSFPLYGITPSQLGDENISYFFIPFVLFLFFLKTIFLNSTWIVITIFHGLMLTVAFSSVYLITLEFLKKVKKQEPIFAGIASGLFYVFTPAIFGNWDKALVTHNQFFLNPLIFYLILKYLHTKQIKYPLLAILITFLFSPNFSFISAPPFFAFFPLVFLYFLAYWFFIIKSGPPLKQVVSLLLLFIIVQSYHLIPQFFMLFSKTSNAFYRVFSTESISDSLEYFSRVSPSVKLSSNLLASPQSTDPFPFLYFVYPALLLIGLIVQNKIGKKNNLNKNFLLLFVLFLSALFLDTGNITSAGLSFYKLFFSIPGFGMFRNFYGQFMYVFYFFYALVLGQALYFVLTWVKVKKTFLYFIIIFAIIFNGLPFIRGDMVNLPIFEAKNVKVPFKMDKDLEETLGFVKNINTDSKIVTLPLTDFGYQLFSGTEGGVYIGPSSVGYLTGKADFPGYGGFGPYTSEVFKSIREKDYESIKKLFSFLNVGYVFYNSDSYIYDNFPKYPYYTTKKYFPNQKSILEFVENLNARKVFEKGHYVIYKLGDFYLPHFYTAKKTVYSNNPLNALVTKENDNRFAVLDARDYEKNNEKLILSAQNLSPYYNLKDNSHLHFHQPYVWIKPDSIFYGGVLLKEDFELKVNQKNQNKYINLGLFFLSKRVSEFERWGPPSETSLKDFFARYKKNTESLNEYLIREITDQDLKQSYKIMVAQQVLFHEEKVINSIYNFNLLENKRDSFLNSVKKEFGEIYRNNKLKSESQTISKYSLNITDNQFGKYKVYIQKNKKDSLELLNSYMLVNGQKFSGEVNLEDYYFGEVDLKKEKNDYIYYHKQDFVQDNNFVQKGNQYIKNIILKPKTQYLITFESRTLEKDYTFMLLDKLPQIGTTAFYEKQLLKVNLSSKNWVSNQFVFSTDEWSKGILILISPKISDGKSFEIKDLKLAEIPDLDIVFEKVTAEKTIKTPKMFFKKVNPTKYEINIWNAKDPYFLIFSQSYNKGWKVFLKTSPSLESNEITGSFFNGEIGEGGHKNVFFDFNTFETWGKKSVTDKNYLTNAYANAWYITPENVKGKNNYTLIVEFLPQRLFYFSIVFSMIGLVITIFLFFKNEKNN